MKKLVFSITLITTAVISHAQMRIGLIAAPEISFGKVLDADTIKSDGSTFLGRFGLEFDFPINDNAAFSTGLIYTPKRLALKASANNITLKEEYKIQYLQLPVTLKLFTSEIQPDLKAYFQLGFLGEILLNDEPVDDDNIVVDKFKFFDFSFTGGAGIEYGGVFYDLGLVDVIKDYNNDIDDNFAAKMRAWSLKVGLKF